MRKVALILVFTFAFSLCRAQFYERKTLYNFQLNQGTVTSVKDGNVLAYGATALTLIPVQDADYFVAGLKVVSSPFEGGPFWFFKNGFNVKGDALNYLMALTGMRLGFQETEGGYFYAEPKAGVVFASGFAWSGLGISPALGFQTRTIDFSLFMDYSHSNKKLNTKRKSFATIGIGVGVNF